MVTFIQPSNCAICAFNDEMPFENLQKKKENTKRRLIWNIKQNRQWNQQRKQRISNTANSHKRMKKYLYIHKIEIAPRKMSMEYWWPIHGQQLSIESSNILYFPFCSTLNSEYHHRIQIVKSKKNEHTLCEVRDSLRPQFQIWNKASISIDPKYIFSEYCTYRRYGMMVLSICVYKNVCKKRDPTETLESKRKKENEENSNELCCFFFFSLCSMQNSRMNDERNCNWLNVERIHIP